MSDVKDSPTQWMALLKRQAEGLTLEQERAILREATTNIKIDRFRNDPQLLEIWLRYIQVERHSGQNYWEISDLFKFLKSARVGLTSTLFYTEWAMFEVESGYPQKGIAILESALLMKIEPINNIKDAVVAIETRTANSQSTKDKHCNLPANDKENEYPKQSVVQNKVRTRRALGNRISAKTTIPYTVTIQETDIAFKDTKLLPVTLESISHHPTKEVDVSSEVMTPQNTTNCALAPKKKHQARMARLLQRPLLGPPSRQSRLNQTQSLLAAEVGSPTSEKAGKSPVISPLQSRPESEKDSENRPPTPPHSSPNVPKEKLEYPLNESDDRTISAMKKPSNDETPKYRNPSKPVTFKEKVCSSKSYVPQYQEYMMPLKSEESSSSKKEITVNCIKYQKMDLIGRGGSSKVFKIMDAQKGKIYALKKVKLNGEDPSVIEGYHNEIALLRRLKGNKHIIQLVDFEICKDSLLMILEFGEIDLAGILRRNQGQSLSRNSIKMYWEQMLHAVHAIHEENIIHSDLKPANFLLVEGSLRLIDFGIAKAIPNDTTNIHRDHQTGTINYMSPESIMFVDSQDAKLLKVGRASDVWSLGCILYQMLYGSPPFAQITPIVRKLQCIVNPDFHISFDPIKDALGVESIQGCLQRNPKRRWTIPQLLEHDFLKLDVHRVWMTEDIIVDVLKFGLTDLFGTSQDVSMEDLRRIAEKLMQRYKCQT